MAAKKTTGVAGQVGYIDVDDWNYRLKSVEEVIENYGHDESVVLVEVTAVRKVGLKTSPSLEEVK